MLVSNQSLTITMYPKFVFSQTKIICAHYVHTKYCRREQQYEECEKNFFITIILPPTKEIVKCSGHKEVF